MFFFSSIFSNSQIPRRYLAIALLFFSTTIKGQNLIPNPSFELGTCCSIPGTCFWHFPMPNASWNDSTFQFAGVSFSACSNNIIDQYKGVPFNNSGFQFANTGISYGCIELKGLQQGLPIYNQRLFLQNSLQQMLVPNSKYDIEIYVSLADHYRFACDNIQMLFTDTIPIYTYNGTIITNLTQYTNLAVFRTDSLNDKINWQKIKATYYAKGTEKYISIGNYMPDELSVSYAVPSDYPADTLGFGWDYAIYYIDDVSLTLGIDAGKDTTICTNTNNNLQLKASPGWQHYTWQTATGAIVGNTQMININTPNTYIVTGTVDSLPNYSKIDTVVVNAYSIAPELYIAQAPNSVTVCPQTPVTLSVVNQNNVLNYLWQTGSTAPSITVNDSGTYQIKIYNNNCHKKDSVTVSYYSNQQSLLDSSTYHLTNLQNSITANVGFTNYEWRNENNEVISNTQTASIQNSKFKIQNYYVVGTNQEGCLIQDTIQIIYNELPIIVPNPQFIGKGNSFTIINLPAGSSVALYNALGQIIFAENNYTPNTSLPFGEGRGGAYFYKIVLAGGRVINGKLVIVDK